MCRLLYFGNLIYIKPHQLEPLEYKEITSNYQEFWVKWLNYIEKYSQGIWNLVCVSSWNEFSEFEIEIMRFYCIGKVLRHFGSLGLPWIYCICLRWYYRKCITDLYCSLDLLWVCSLYPYCSSSRQTNTINYSTYWSNGSMSECTYM